MSPDNIFEYMKQVLRHFSVEELSFTCVQQKKILCIVFQRLGFEKKMEINIFHINKSCFQLEDVAPSVFS